MTGPPGFVARGFIGLDVLSFGVQVRNEGWEDAVFDLIDVTGMGRQFLEAQQNQCPSIYCVA
ncbi:hypothetical protein [Amycolatopsis sp. FDAARGOS 1241]|uniref:hypothetical protein n=1 Tax=Amycolatopsis sp. FDAARGOS 1241 TaxID=2778070 RepID=UPI00195238D1|nr:hypothetical protein [Amycolatopsis sp. FDAARGOS 1241]QRP42708.1 hypothetical protein I6J71_24790 [Amycolatopsis sp. FDAARGOS 1241]